MLIGKAGFIEATLTKQLKMVKKNIRDKEIDFYLKRQNAVYQMLQKVQKE